MSNEEFDDLVLLVKILRSLRNNRRFQKKEENGEARSKKIICYDCDKPGHKRTEYEVPKKTKSKWFLDSGCLKHMTGDRSLLSNFQEKDGGHVTFGDNAKGKIIGFENIGNHSSPSIENVLLVDNLKHNLLNISQ
ncbi:uncharacterized protein LOC111365523 [Olea europaea var. sylvestris]|uniref:uncharacterized protein LOC111365523 n=1 Tax=Olea europaea var. sylvestris TaxID=158386 RepID=UPI000C1D64BB|nr:uncharacterized protein LOC111365523 [Olea europaea var. sylvestris]